MASGHTFLLLLSKSRNCKLSVSLQALTLRCYARGGLEPPPSYTPNSYMTERQLRHIVMIVIAEGWWVAEEVATRCLDASLTHPEMTLNIVEYLEYLGTSPS